MVDILNDLESWLHRQVPFALATVIKTWRSAPRSEGATMIIAADGTMKGSVSGGCVESSVVKEAQLMLQGDYQSKRLSFGVSDEDAWSVGLSCGGAIEVWLEQVSHPDVWTRLIAMVKSNQGCVLVTGLQEGKPFKALYTMHQLLGDEMDQELQVTCEQAYTQHKTQISEGYFLHVFPAKSRLIIIGAAHVSLDLIRLAKMYQFETIVIDPRGIFTQEQRFEVTPDQLFTDWPEQVLPGIKLDADTYVVVLTHDPKIDDQALRLVLAAGVAYVGALGSRKTHAKRTIRLKESGVPEEQIEQIYGPVGLDINARHPSEIALSIMAQIIGIKNQYL